MSLPVPALIAWDAHPEAELSDSKVCNFEFLKIHLSCPALFTSICCLLCFRPRTLKVALW